MVYRTSFPEPGLNHDIQTALANPLRGLLENVQDAYRHAPTDAEKNEIEAEIDSIFRDAAPELKEELSLLSLQIDLRYPERNRDYWKEQTR